MTNSRMMRQVRSSSLKTAHFDNHVKKQACHWELLSFFFFWINGQWRGVVELPLVETQWSFPELTGVGIQKLNSLLDVIASTSALV